jgi:GGDEF domain-containing protein
MSMSEGARTRGRALSLAAVAIIAAMLIVVVNPFDVALVYLALLGGAIAIGLMTNVWGGLAASAISVFAIVLIDQATGIYPRENALLNIATELAAFLAAGPAAGSLAAAINRVQREADRWLARAEELSVHDDVFGTLKPDWAKLRLDEEIVRARRFDRPLSIALLHLAPSAAAPIDNRAERVAALQAVIRVARAVTRPPTIVTHAGGDQVLVVLPEHTLDQAQNVIERVRQQVDREPYFPKHRDLNKDLGKPVHDWGQLRIGLVALNGQAASSETLLASARAALKEHNA